jgi:hypothetical protein
MHTPRTQRQAIEDIETIMHRLDIRDRSLIASAAKDTHERLKEAMDDDAEVGPSLLSMQFACEHMNVPTERAFINRYPEVSVIDLAINIADELTFSYSSTNKLRKFLLTADKLWRGDEGFMEDLVICLKNAKLEYERDLTRVVSEVAIVTLLDAKHGPEGQPRRLLRLSVIRTFFTGSHEVQHMHVEEGYSGDQIMKLALKRLPPENIHWAGSLKITPDAFRTLKAEATASTSKLLSAELQEQRARE